MTTPCPIWLVTSRWVACELLRGSFRAWWKAPSETEGNLLWYTAMLSLMVEQSTASMWNMPLCCSQLASSQWSLAQIIISPLAGFLGASMQSSNTSWAQSPARFSVKSLLAITPPLKIWMRLTEGLLANRVKGTLLLSCTVMQTQLVDFRLQGLKAQLCTLAPWQMKCELLLSGMAWVRLAARVPSYTLTRMEEKVFSWACKDSRHGLDGPVWTGRVSRQWVVGGSSPATLRALSRLNGTTVGSPSALWRIRPKLTQLAIKVQKRRNLIIQIYAHRRVNLILVEVVIYNSMARRVVITGAGMVSPLGNTLPQSWSALASGKSGIARYDNDPVLKNTKPLNLALVKNFEYKKWQAPHAPSRQNSFVLCAAHEALAMSRLDLSQMGRQRVGVSMGVIGSNNTKITEFANESLSTNFHNINRLSLLHLITSIPTGILDVKYKLTGPTITVNTACASGLSAIVQAAKYIKYDQADVVLAGGVEDGYNPLQINSCLRIQAMTSKQYDMPEQASRPYDRRRSGFVLGEGCGVLVVEELQHARSRGAVVLAELLGFGESSDGHHLVKPEESGRGQVRAMELALGRSGLKKQQIQVVDCHATSTPAGDEIEANSILKVFGTHQPYMTAHKSAMGHTLGAAGALEFIFALQALNTGIVPAIRNLQEPDVLGPRYVRGENINTEVKHILKNSFGFGGVNVSMVLGKLSN